MTVMKLYNVIQTADTPLIILFPQFGDHPHLHSFPTRRSSDLPMSEMNQRALPRAFRRLAWSNLVAQPARSGRRTRSEEHTSELQSRFDLVCRLLLEKKK